MALAPGSLLAAVLLLVSSGLHRSSSSLAPCPESCSCQRAPLLNCSSSGLSSVPQHIPDSVTELDLSHNLLDSVTLDRPHRDLSSVWLGNNNIKQLSLCVERDIGGPYVRGRRLKHRLKPWRGGRGCVSWAPTLQLLSVERNQLEKLPQGMEGSESLQVLQLSFNKISTVQPGDLTHLRQLKELHLQHNLITSLHPQMFQDLAQLQVLDLSFNMLTSLHPLTYLTLRNIGADVMLGGNRWRCDCSMRSLRRRMAYDSSRGLQAWSVMCASPSMLSGRDLLQLEEDDLNCFSPENGPELHRDVTVYKGSEILLSCATKDSTWWTPSGQAPVSQPEAGLVISDITETDTGLYVCVSEEHEVVSVFNLQISKTGDARRKTRSLPRIPQGTPNRIGQQRNQTVTQSNFALAVSLSVFITFLIAFILGVIARPCIDALLRRVTKKKRSSAANSVSSVEQRQYDNGAFFDGEGPEHNGPHRERRVTFSTVDFREDGNVQYYDTVAGGNQGNINSDAVIECEAAEAERATNTAGDSGSENSLRQSSPEDNRRDLADTGRAHNMEFEHIPDPVEMVVRRRSLSSDSSQSDKVFNEDQMIQGDHSTPKTPQQAEDSVQQRADSSTARNVEVTQISIEGTSELPGFSSEPFADWSPYKNNTNPTDLWQENEEQFEFSDSARSMSARSSGVLGSFNASKLTVAPTSDKQMTDVMSSSSSYVSEDEPTQYVVNSDPEEEDTERNHNKPEVTNAGLKQGASFEQQIHGVDSIRPSAVRPEGSFSSHSSDSDGEDYRVKKGRVPNLAVTSHTKSLDTRSPSPPAAYSSSSSSESEAEITDLKVEHNTGSMNEGIKINVPEILSTDLDRQCIPQIKRRVDIKAPLPDSDSSSSDESTDEATNHTKKQEQDHATPIKRRWDISAPSPPTDSSSSSDSEDETTNHTKKQEQGGTYMAKLPVVVSQNVSHDPQPRWPAQDLEDTMHVKRHLDVKAPSPASDSSSSSDSEDETTGHMKKQEQGQINMDKVSQNVSHDPQQQWPALDLEDTMHVKRRIDIKAPSPPPDSSSNSDSEDETTHHTKIDRLQYQESQTGSRDPDTRWPVLDLEDTARVKKRLDIKAPSPPPDSSSSSDSEDETTDHMKKQEQGGMSMTRLPSKVSQTASYDPQKQWPALDLEHTMRIKRRIDIKAPPPPPDSSSSSDSEAETTHHTKIDRLPYQESQTLSHDPDTRWPVIDLEDTMRVKKRLDIKAPSPPPDSSSSSDSEHETTCHMKKQEQGQINMDKVSQTASYDPEEKWPALDLEDTMHVKRRIDIKAPSPPPDSSSNSDSEDETTIHIKKQEQGGTYIARLPVEVSQNVSHDPQQQWPVLDLEDTMPVKNRLDVKVPSPASDSSSSSDSEDETTHHTKIDRLQYQESQTGSRDPDTRWPVLDLEDTARVKKRLDIKAPSPPPDSSSSSDSEDETTGHMKKQEQGGVSMTRLPSKVSQTASYDPQKQWPALDLEHTMRFKRRIDIKAPPPPPDSSSSSDSEAETTHHTKIERLPYQESQTLSHDPDTRWPVLDLEDTMRVKKRLDIKGPSLPPDSSSSSDSEDETTHHTKIERTGVVEIAGLPYQESQTGSHDPEKQWPSIDLEHIPRIKKRLDIKAPLPPPDSSSSSDSEDETTGHMKKQEQGGVSMTRLPSKVSQTASYDAQTQWPVLDLEDTMRVKKRLDVKAPSPPPDSSSSSDSEDETTHHTKIERLQYQESQTGSHNPDTRWPVIDLEDTMRIKRRIDIKAPSPPPDSSSSSDSEDETTGHMKIERPGVVGIAGLPYQESQTGSHDPEKQWPSINLDHTMRIKRRLDIKAPSPPPDSSLSGGSTNHTVEGKRGEAIKISPRHSSSSSDEQEEGVEVDPDSRWPRLDLSSALHVKRHLDIKAPSPPPDSSSSGGSTNHTVGGKSREAIKISPSHSSSSSDEQEESVEVDPDSRWPRLDLSSALHVKRRLDIKARSPPPESSSSSVHEGGSTNLPVKVETKLPKLSPGVPYINRRLDFSRPSESNSSRSDSEDEYRDHAKAGLGVSAISKATEKEFIRSPKTPVINISRSPKTDIKLERYTAITNEVGDKTTSDNISTTPEINPELQSRWSTMNLGYSRFRRRLEISSHTQEPPNLPSTPPPDSPSSSSSESGTGSKSSTTRRKRRGVQEIIQTESSENKPVNVSLSLKGRDENSGNSVEVTERLRKGTSEEKSNPYTMLTDPHFRRYLDFKVREKAPATPPPLDQPQSQTEEMQRKAGVELKSQASKVGVEPDSHSILTNIPHIKRALDIKAPSQRESSSSSNSEDETIDHSVPDLSLGVPRIKRRLDVKAPLPEPSHSTSSGSESENEVTRYNKSRHASNMSGLTDDDSLITYKRVIMKASLPPSNSFSPSGKSQTIDLTKQRLGDRNASLAPKRVPSLSFEDVLKKRLEQPRSTTDVDLPPEIRWTGVGRHLSDLPIPSQRRHLDVGLSSPPAEPDLPPPDSSNSSSSESDDNIKQDKGKADVPLMHKHSSLGAYSVSLASSRALDKFDSPPSSTNEILRAASGERNERKGLSALKAMSSERRKWDTLDESLDKGASPLFDDHRPQGDGKDIKPLAKQPPTQLQQRRALDLLYGVPRYRRHDIEPPQGPPPPIPATPPPYEAVGLTWRSPQSGTKPGLEGTRNTEESDSSPLTTQKLAVYLDSSDVNISEV